MRRSTARRALGAGAVFAAALVSSVPLCLRLPAARRAAANAVNRALAPVFAGRITIERVGRLGLTEIDDVDVRLDDADGRPLLRAAGVRARVSTWTLARTALVGAGQELAVVVPELVVPRLDGVVDQDPGGALRIARALSLRAPRGPGEPHGRRVRVDLERVVVDGASIRLRPDAGPAPDVDVQGAQGALHLGGDELAVDLSRARMIVAGLPGGVRAQGEFGGVIRLAVGDAPPHSLLRTAWNGVVGTIRGRVVMSDTDGHVDAELDVGSATPDEVRAVWPQCPFTEALDAHLEAHGTPARLDVRARAHIGRGTIDGRGPVELGASPRAALHVEATAFDAHACAAQAPASEVALSGDVAVTGEPAGGLEADGTLAISGGRLLGVEVPPSTVTGRIEQSAGGELAGGAELTVRRAGASTVISARLDGGARVLAFEGESTLPRVDVLGGAASGLGGSAIVRAAGAVDLAAGTLDARVSVGLSRLAARGASIAQARVDAHATGRLAAPAITLEVDGEDAQAGPLRLAALRGRAAAAIDAGGLSLRDVDVEAAGAGAPVRAQAAALRVAPGELRADGVVVDGLGEPLVVSLRAAPIGVAVRAQSGGLDLARVADFATLPVAGGRLALDVDGTLSARAAEGRIVLDLQHAAFAGLADANARADIVVAGRRARGSIKASLGDVGTLDVRSSSVTIGDGHLLTAAPWRKTWGTVEFDGHADLERVAARVPAAALGLDELRGAIDVSGQVSRDDARDETPAVVFAAHTTGLVVGARRASGAWRLDGVDPTLRVSVDGGTGNTRADVVWSDARGALLTLSASSGAVPYALIFSEEDPIDALRAMPFDARLEVPRRSVSSLPAALRVGALDSEVEATASWHGAVVEPAIDVAASLHGGRAGSGVLSMPVDLAVGARYNGAALDATLRATARDRPVMQASARVQARATDVLAAMAGAPLPWTGSARATLDRFPLQRVAWFDDRQVRGTVSGEASVEGVHADAHGRLALSFDRLEVGEVSCRASTVSLEVDGRALDLAARLDHGDGFVESRARFAATWGSAVVPRIDTSRPLEAAVSARHLRAAVLLPFVSRWLTTLDGRLDVNAGLQVGADGVARPRATVALSDGAFEAASFGGAFRSASGKLTVTQDGLVRLEDASAQALSGRVQAAATARLDGLELSGARAVVSVAAKDPVPLVFDGVKLGAIDGRFELAVDRPADKGLDVTVDVPTAHLQLPPTSASLDVQPLGELAGVKVGVKSAAGDFVDVPLDGSHEDDAAVAAARRNPVRVAVRLGDMQVSRGTDLDVRLEGQQTVVMADRTTVAGQVRIARGTFDVQGKPFAVDRGTVTFVGDDPSDPQVVLTASWAAPDGTTVYADFVGPLKTGKVKLRSEPSRTQSEILALILFGSADEQTGSPASASAQASTVAAAAGGAATQPLNRFLGGIDRALDSVGLAAGISTKIDTSKVNPRPEVEVQIARDISLQVAWVLGVPPPGTNPDSTLVTLNWHFLRKWSLATTVGDAGTSVVDLLWQHHY